MFLQYSLRIGEGAVDRASGKTKPTYVFPACLKEVVRVVIAENIRDYDDPSGRNVSVEHDACVMRHARIPLRIF